MRRCLLLLAALLPPGATPAAESFLDQSMAQWRQGLQSKDPVVRRSSAFALGRLGILASFTVDDLDRLLRDDRDPAVREMAARAIGDIVLTMRHFAPKREWDVVGKTLQAAPRRRRAAARPAGRRLLRWAVSVHSPPRPCRRCARRCATRPPRCGKTPPGRSAASSPAPIGRRSRRCAPC